MKLIHTRSLLAAAIAAGLLAGCSHNDNTVKSDSTAVPAAQSATAVPYNPQATNRSQIPPQFQEQFQDPSKVHHGVNQQPKQ